MWPRLGSLIHVAAALPIDSEIMFGNFEKPNIIEISTQYLFYNNIIDWDNFTGLEPSKKNGSNDVIES